MTTTGRAPRAATRWGRALGAAALVAGFATAWCSLASLPHGAPLRLLVAGTLVGATAFGWASHGPWMPARLAAGYLFGVAAAALFAAGVACV